MELGHNTKQLQIITMFLLLTFASTSTWARPITFQPMTYPGTELFIIRQDLMVALLGNSSTINVQDVSIYNIVNYKLKILFNNNIIIKSIMLRALLLST